MDTVDAAVDHDRGSPPYCLARLGGIAQEVAEDLAQEHFIAVYLGELAGHLNRRPGRQLVPKVVGGAPRDASGIDRAQRDLLRARKVQEVGDHIAKRLRLLADALDIGPILRRQRLRIEQPAISMDRRQAVAELVRDARRQLAQPSERFLQAKLLFELDDIGEIREQADCTARGRGPCNRRDRHAKMRRFHRRRHLHRAAHDRFAGVQAFGDDGNEWNGRAEYDPIRCSDRLGPHLEKPSSSRVEHFHATTVVDDEESRRKAVGDLATQAVGGCRTRSHRLLLRLQLADRLLKRGGQHQRVRAVRAEVTLGRARARDDAQERKRQDADEHRGDRRETKQRVAGLRHDASPVHAKYACNARS